MERTIVCPNCNKPSFQAAQKQMLGPLRVIACRLCGATVSVSRPHSIAVLLLMSILFSFAAPIFIDFGLLAALAFVVFIAIAAGTYYRYRVPLVTRSVGPNG